MAREIVEVSECKERHSKLEGTLQSSVGGAEARIKIWVLTGALGILVAVLTLLMNLGSYKEKVDQHESRLNRIEMILDSMVSRPGGVGGN